MEYGLSIFASTASLTSSGTATATPIPFDTQGYFPRHIRVSTTADCYVAIGDIGVTAVAGDMLLQAGDAQLLHVSDCKAISILSVSGSATVTVAPMELGNWTSDQRTLDYDFTTLAAVPVPVTFTRGSGGGYFGSDGLYKWQGYNRLLQSNKFDTTWTVARLATPTQTGSTAPDGNASWVITEDATAAATHAILQNYSFATATPYTFSIYAKMGTQRWMNLTLPGGAFTSGDVYFDLQNGVKGTETGGAVGVMTSVGNGWYRCSISKTSTGAASGNILVYSTDSGASVSVATPSARTINLYGAQLETASTASQYSPTTTAANSAPRLDYDPSTLLPRGLLVEEQRTNSETNSITPIALKVGDTVSSATGPDGLSSAWLLTADGASGAHGFYQAVVTPVALNTYTVSVFLKAGTQSIVQLATGSAHSGPTVYCNYNLSLNTRSAGAGIVSGSDFMTAIGGGWYRCGFSYVASAAASGAAVPTYAVSTLAAVRGEVTTLATTYYRFGGQYESTSGMGSAPFATSYIPTTTASATRSADSASMTGTNFSSWFNASAGTFVVEGDGTLSGATLPALIGIDDGTTNERMQIRYNSTGSSFAFSVVDGGVVQASVGLGTITSGVVYKSASTYAANDFICALNGTLSTSDLTGTLPTVDRVSFGFAVNSAILNGHIRRIQYYPARLPNATLQALTA